MRKSVIVSVLASSFAAGDSEPERIVVRASEALGRNWRWLGTLAHRYTAAIAGRACPRHRDIVQFIFQDAGFQRAWSKYSHELTISHWIHEPQRMNPVAAARAWNVPAIESAGALADWLWLDPGELAWFADLKALGYKNREPRLRHYSYRVLAKSPGSIRLIEAPKRRLKKLQREILAGILENVPVHSAVHGFVKGRSIKSFAGPHVGRRVVLRIDIRDFFVSFICARVQAFFRTLGYPETVADLLGAICTNATPRDAWHGLGTGIEARQLEQTRAFYARPHLPQGAPTSPALANCCSFRLDCRLAGLAKAAGAQYTRYADDLAFSGDRDFEECVERFSVHTRRSSSKKASTSSTEKLASCGKECGSTSSFPDAPRGSGVLRRNDQPRPRQAAAGIT